MDDFYGPEINSIPVPLPQFPGFRHCAVPHLHAGARRGHRLDDGWTTDLNNIQCYDETHVQAVLNQIDGWNHDHSRKAARADPVRHQLPVSQRRREAGGQRLQRCAGHAFAPDWRANWISWMPRWD